MRATLPPEILHAIRLPTWLALFDALGAPIPARRSARPPSLATHASIAAALLGADLPPPLARALHTIAAFATEAGRTDVYLAARALGFAGRWPDAASPADLVALLLAAAPADPAVAALLDAARILRDRAFRPRASSLFVGARARDPQVGEPTQYVAPLREAFAAWSADGDFGEVVAIDASIAAGVLAYAIVHEDRLETRVQRGRAEGALAAVPSRAVRSHAVTYVPASRRLTITTDLPEVVVPLAKIVGRLFFDDEAHFLAERAFDLGTLQDHGESALDVRSLAPKVTAKAIGGTWHSGKNHALTPRGRDFFLALRRYKIRIEGGRLEQVTLRATIAAPAGGPPSCDVALRPPHHLTIAEPEHAPLLAELLDAARITDPRPRVRDFFVLQPWIEPAAGWIAFEGEEGFRGLVASGLLVPDRANRAVAPPDDPHAGRIATAHPLPDGRFLAWCPDPTVAPFVVTEDELVVYGLSFARLAATIAEALGLDGAASALDDDGVLFCGRRPLGPTHVLVFLLTRPIRSATAARLREAAEHGHAVVIAPEGRSAEHGIRQVAMPPLAGPWRPLVGAIVRALHVESFVATTIYAPTEARVVLHRATKRVWIDGVLCAALGEAHVRLLELLAANPGQAVFTKDIADRVAQGKAHDDTTRKTIDSFVAAVTKSFKGEGREPPADLRRFIVQPRRAFYSLSVAIFVE